ncbi:MAG: MaoC family dehydratase N-terminal domain-containing protein [Parvibaculum sp.]
MSSQQEAAPAEEHSEAVGRTEQVQDLVAVDRVNALAMTLDMDAAFSDGAVLPPGWHWLFFNPFVRRSELGQDGHPKRGGFLPDVGLPRRMWAGGRLRYVAPVRMGATATRHSTIEKVSAKSGRAGRLVFVTVRHVITQDGGTCIEEEQDIVYREAATPGAPPPRPEPAPDGAEWSEVVHPDSVLLFRYSALTSNGHRIHYDLPYAQQEESYRSLVVHGPLTATLLQGFAARCRPGSALASFSFRGVSPLFVDRSFMQQAAANGDGSLLLWARGPGGELAMRAEAGFGDGQR